MVQQVHLAHLPSDIAIYATIFRDVENSGYLREQLLAGNTDFEYAFVDATLLISTKQILAATFRAILDMMSDRLKSRNVHSEVVFSLSPNNNIAEAFRRFGVQESTKDIVVLKIATNQAITLESVQSHLTGSIQGTECSFTDSVLRSCSDLARIRKVYKLNTGVTKQPSVVNGNTEVGDNDFAQLERQILGAMALRGAT